MGETEDVHGLGTISATFLRNYARLSPRLSHPLFKSLAVYSNNYQNIISATECIERAAADHESSHARTLVSGHAGEAYSQKTNKR